MTNELIRYRLQPRFLLVALLVLSALAFAGKQRGYSGHLTGSDVIVGDESDHEIDGMLNSYVIDSMGSDYLWPMNGADVAGNGSVSDYHAIAVGWQSPNPPVVSGVIYRSTTGISVNEWENILSTPYELNAVNWVNSASWFVVVGDNGFVYTLPRSGSLTQRVSHTSNDLYAVDEHGMTVIAVGANGSIIRSSNGGSSWTAEMYNPGGGFGPDLLDVCVWDTYKALAVGENGTIIQTTDGGDNWTAISSPASNDLHGVCSGLTGYFCVVGDDEQLYSTGGVTNWQQAQFPHNNILLKTVIRNDFFDVWYAAGEDGRVYCCENNAANDWFLLAPYEDETFYPDLEHPINDLFSFWWNPGNQKCTYFVGSASYDHLD